jgi:hypothetical protein
MGFGEFWGTFSVNDHVRHRALVAQVLLFDRLVIPVPPKDDSIELERWITHGWQPERQRRMLEILGVGPSADDLAVTVPWTERKRDEFKVLSQSRLSANSGAERSKFVQGVVSDTQQLKPDSQMITRIMLTREYDAGEEEYVKTLPRTWVQSVVPAYASYVAAEAELRMKIAESPGAAQSACVIGWDLFVPEDSDWSDEHALEAAAKLARSAEYRYERETFRDWWRGGVERGAPPEQAVAELAKRADRLNQIASDNNRRTNLLHGFAALGGAVALAGVWFPPAVVAGAFMALVGIGADWVTHDQAAPEALAPAAMFADARRHLGWR